ncbi:Rne/Rng family ribonuclease [Novosphingopyxis sp.]|uniref:ribonuclease E/G n=1 Tax=Novosphingopyxis sp. TaxID=2709690 RepID=UPI003B5AFB0F
MTTRMLIDARHREETRVAVVKGNRIEEFDFESAEHEQLKGNIYLAKVTRVEPSLQAAFIDYGGNRHGFLAFSEIHPDYYQIPKEDRDRLLAEEAEAAEEEAAAREAEDDADDLAETSGDDDGALDEPELVEVDKDTSVDTIDAEEGEMPDLDEEASDDGDESNGDESNGDGGNGRGRGRGRGRGGKGGGRGRSSAAKASDAARAKRQELRRRYKIQDVIHRRQVLLVQVVKEERGNKGAALTTYLSLAGRYCVLMPNTSHGGGISRKISSASDRKRLKSIVDDLNLPRTMGCIVRTAGLSRTKPEIKRDFDYLARLWDEIRERTLGSAAPALIHSDSALIKRAIRDIYNREIDEVMVEGDEGYKSAKAFMKLLMPSHARKVKQYADPVPLFQRHGVEDQLSAMYQPVVQLKSGGYIVINPTEALVSIDINSGRSTKEHGIEQTALSTNMEAAREIARQLRLRDMAGLVVIDFIDMEKHGNSRKVERCLKESLKHDRARIQVGRISSFGLMEMSRQRLRTGVLEASTRECPHCEGTGLVRTASSAGLTALRHIEEEAAKGKGREITLRASQEATIYVLNSKRNELAEIEERYGVTIEILPNSEAEGAKMTVSSAGGKPDKQVAFEPILDEEDFAEDILDEREDEEDEPEKEEREERPRRQPRQRQREEQGETDDDQPKRKRRRRGRRGGRGRKREEDEQSNQSGEGQEGEAPATEDGAEDKPKARRGRRRKSVDQDQSGEGVETSAASDDTAKGEQAKADAPEAGAPEAGTDETAPKKRPRRRPAKAKPAESDSKAGEEAATTDTAATEDKPKPRRRSSAKNADVEKADGNEAEARDGDSKDVEAKADKPKPRARRKKAEASEPAVDAVEHEAAVPAPKAEPIAKAANDGAGAARIEAGGANTTTDHGTPRRGWWQRTFG